MSRQRVPNLELAADSARANLLTNGGFEVWQRGAGAFTANATYNADRWITSIGGGSTLSISRDATNVDSGSAFAAACTYTHSTETFVYQVLEDYKGLRGRTLTLSMRVKTSTASAVRLAFQCNGSNTYGSYHTGDGTWQTLTLTLAIPAGTTSLLGAYTLNASCTAYLDNAMLVTGSVAADYAPLHPAEDLARCLRYYEVLPYTNGMYMSMGFSYATGAAIFAMRFARKCLLPTITVSATPSISNGSAGVVTPSSVSMTASNTDSMGIIGNVASGLTVGQGSVLWPSASGCSIMLEANP